MDRDLQAALRKAFGAAGVGMPRGGAALLSVDGGDLRRVVPLGDVLARLGCRLVAAWQTALALAAPGVAIPPVGDAEALAAVMGGEIDLVIVTAVPGRIRSLATAPARGSAGLPPSGG